MTPQELKNSILQLAIQGKLVEQRPEEGTAEELFERLKVHHSGLKPCKDELDYSSMDFDIPESWKMIELNQLFDFVDYRGKTPNKISKGVFLITASNIKQGYMDYTRKEFISYEEYEGRQSRGITQKGDLLFTTEAPMGNAALCDLDICSCGQRIITFKPYTGNAAIPELFMYFLLSSPFQKQLLCNCTGTTAKGIKADKLKHFLLPLPPLAEQKRIVARIEELLPLIDRYEKAWIRLEDFNKRFPGDMQKSILQMAIQGKLVEQLPEEGTGEELYQQIQKEKQALINAGKIKKEKPLPKISENEIPFEIPESWKWVRLDEIVTKEIKRGKSPTYVPKSGTLVFAQKCNTKAGYIDLSLSLYLDETKLSKYPESEFMRDKDIVINSTGNGTLGRVGIYRDSDNPRHLPLVPDSHVTVIRTSSVICIEYVFYCLKYYQPYMEKLGSGSTNQTELSASIVRALLFPLPPLAEQKRIVARLEELLPLCGKLK